MNRFLFDDEKGPAGGRADAEPPVVGSAAAGDLRLPRPPCANHARVPSVHACAGCFTAICETCAFSFPGDRRFCPACATAPRDALVGWRRTSVNWGLALAAIGTCGIVGAPILWGLGGSPGPEGEAALGGVMGLLGMLPSLVGLAVSIGAHEQQTANPPRLWTAIVWNAAIVALFLVMMLAGLVMKES